MNYFDSKKRFEKKIFLKNVFFSFFVFLFLLLGFFSYLHFKKDDYISIDVFGHNKKFIFNSSFKSLNIKNINYDEDLIYVNGVLSTFDHVILKNDKIKIVDVFFKERIEKKVLNYEVTYSDEVALKIGSYLVVVEGQNGSEELVFKDEFRNGILFNSSLITQNSTPVVNKLVLVGKGEETVIFIDNSKKEYVQNPEKEELPEPKNDFKKDDKCSISINGLIKPCVVN